MGKKSVPAIEITNLRVIRGGKEVIPDLSLTIQRGALVGLLGPSGHGKSTLMRSIVGAQIIVDGTVTVLGQEAGTAPLRHKVGYVTQDPSVYTDLTPRENLEYFAALLRAPKSDVAHALNVVRLNDVADRPVNTLSGGQQSRASLAVAMLNRPEVLVLDEPTVGLDPVLRRDLWTTFRSLAKSGVTLLVSSHVMDEATRCDRLLFMRDGDFIADGTLRSILKKTKAKDAEGAFLAIADATDKKAVAA